jgi:hypothetical protein
MRILAACVAAITVVTVMAQEPEQPRLLHASDLVYSGAFRLPGGHANQQSFEYGGRGLAFSPSRNTLLLAGHDWYQWIGELNIPELRISESLADLQTATFRTPLTEIGTHSTPTVGRGSTAVGGLLPWGDSLIASYYLTYDATGSQTASHYKRGLDLTKREDLRGPYTVGNGRAGFVSGYMAPIPAEWREALGGAAIAGQCCISIISRTSLGPSATVFNPDTIGTGERVPGIEVLGYPITKPTLGTCESTNATFNCATTMGGVVFPDGTRSVLFFGRQGIGPYCYGDASPVQGRTACLDPTDGAKGPHAYPYQFQVWAYDVLDLIAVRQGRKEPWQVMPYETWSFELPFAPGSRVIRGVTYDPATRRIYMATVFGDGPRPVIQAFTVGAPVPATPPRR